MPKRNVKLFYNEMCKNEKLQNEIKEVLGVANTESDKQALLNNIAKKYNFDFTPEEAKKFAENLIKNKLSLDDLSEVSGGIGRRTAILAFSALTALGSLGSAGAIVSHAGQNFSTPGNNNNYYYYDRNNTNSEKSKSEGAGNNTTPTTPANKDDSNNKMEIKKDEDLKKGVEDLDKKIQNVNNEINIKNVNNNENTGGDATILPTSANKYDSNNNKIKIKKDEDLKKGLNDLDKKIQNVKNEKQEKEEKERLRKDREEKSNKLKSEIITADNINLFEGLVCSTDNLNLLYRMTRDGANKDAMQNKLDGHSNIVVLVKTDENKIFGGYTSRKLEYNDALKRDNKSFLFSIDLYEKFNVKENIIVIIDSYFFGINFGNLILFNKNNECYSYFGNENVSSYENNGITRNEFCGGKEKSDWFGRKYSQFNPIEIEIFEIKDDSENSKYLFDYSESSDIVDDY